MTSGDDEELLELSLRETLERLAAETPAPAGGALAAIAAAGAAAMVEMGSALTLGRERYRGAWPAMAEARERARRLRTELLDLAVADGRAYAGVVAALRLPQDTDDARAARRRALDAALLAAAGPPARILRAAAEVAELAADVAERGNANLLGDAATAALVGEAAGRAAATLVEIDAGQTRLPAAADLLVAARADQARAGDARTRALAAADARRPRG